MDLTGYILCIIQGVPFFIRIALGALTGLNFKVKCRNGSVYLPTVRGDKRKKNERRDEI